jgi:hypothetical protein
MTLIRCLFRMTAPHFTMSHQYTQFTIANWADASFNRASFDAYVGYNPLNS